MKRLALAALLLALAFALPLRAEEPARFLIERIDVRNLVHASADVVKSESRLREGNAYGEAELRDANHRIKRLPFVLDAAFSLEKGSVRDAYVLVITVNETRPLFYLLDAVYFEKANGRIVIDSTDAAVLGARMFVGRSDVVHLAAVEHKDDRPFEANYSSIQAGYTRYGLFDGRVFATFTIDRNLRSTSVDEQAKIEPGALIGVALSPNRTLTVSYTAVDLSSERSRHAERMLQARFAYNTTDHPFFPNDGSLLSIAPLFARTDVFSSTQPLVHSQDVGVEAEVARYLPLTDRFTFGADATGGLVREQEHGASFVSRTARYGAAFLKISRRMGALDADSDHRIELTLRSVSKQHDFTPLFRDASTQLSVTWVRRNAWGILRLGVGYAR